MRTTGLAGRTGAVALLALLAAAPVDARTLSFRTETGRVTKALACRKPQLIPATPVDGALYACLGGKSETVKFFVNEMEGRPNVKNVTLVWLDRIQGGAVAQHADREAAEKFVATFAKLYAPQLQKRIAAAFFADVNKSFTTNDYTIIYTYYRGPMNDERVVVATPR